MDGRRLSRTDNGVTTTFVYAGDQLVGQTWGGNTLAFICNAAGEYVGFTYNGTNYYYVKNLQGDVVQIVNAAKTTVVKYYYDAWGYNFATEGSLASTVGAVNPIRYRSYYYDSGTGLYYLYSRYYNPELRRFISPDKLLDTRSLDGYNLFAYCANNPVIGFDPFGFAIEDAYSEAFGRYYFGTAVGVGIAGSLWLWIESVGSAIIQGIEDSVASIIDGIQKVVEGNSLDNQYVYVLCDKSTKEIRYVGRTNDPDRRNNEHKLMREFNNLDNLQVVACGLSKQQARLYEQLLISVYTKNRLLNLRRGIALKNIGDFVNVFGEYISLECSVAWDEIEDVLRRWD